ncbi:phosphatidylinositol 4-kinase [Acrasis kona]|uniref:1-phosphatidylinositol 4-kinase n=1 Tax=Acrasis kona TaxID=1008807 RepID=A0AAW2ZTS9_9EUKA
MSSSGELTNTQPNKYAPLSSTSISTPLSSVAPNSVVTNVQRSPREFEPRSNVSEVYTGLSPVLDQNDLVRIFSDPANVSASKVIYHLSKHDDHKEGHRGCFLYLVNKLHELKPEDVEFYLPQILNIYITKVTEKRSALEKYLLGLCANSLHFGIRLSWYIDAECSHLFVQARATPYDSPQFRQYNQCLEFRNLVEEVTISQSLNVLNQDQERQHQSSSSNDFIKQLNSESDTVFNRQRRLNYFNDEHQFIWFMTDLSSRLRAYPLGSIRTQRMRSELENVNGIIPNGVYIPICDMNDSHARVVRLVSGECCVFSTKERVPYLIFLENLKNPFSVSKPVIQFTQEKQDHHPSPRSHHKHQKTTSLPKDDELLLITSSSETHHEEEINPLEPSTPKDLNDVEKKTLITILSKENVERIKQSNSLASIQEALTQVQQETPEEVETRTKKEAFKRDFEELEKRNAMENQRRIAMSIADSDFVMLDRTKDIENNEADRKALLYACYGESFEEKKERVRHTSPYGHLPGWDVSSFIVKANDDIRQEHFAMQLINVCARIFEREALPIYIKPYHVIVTDRDCGLIECVTDTISLDSLKKKFPNFSTLYDYFVTTFGEQGSPAFKSAQTNFVESMAGYSVLCYILQIKDRHNGNIMLHRDGHVVHIDFGFFLGNSPGSINFESAPFKLTGEFVDVMGGGNHQMFDHFRMLVFLGLRCLSKHKHEILSLVEMMTGYNFPCFAQGPANVLRDLDARFHSELKETDFAQWARNLVDESLYNWRTRQYDNFQRLTNGIL